MVLYSWPSSLQSVDVAMVVSILANRAKRCFLYATGVLKVGLCDRVL